jgi:ATP-dependent helicase/nuclease subunit A
LALRVVRLLLSGVAPSKILCLTFTKAAAANMAARVFDTLAAWTSLDDNALTRAIVEIGAHPPNSERLQFARCLFARAVETPGGLKIQTIHAFCEKLLHQFPFEANVAATFAVIDDAQQAALIDLARRETLGSAVETDDQALLAALQSLASQTTERSLDELISQAVPMRIKLQAIIADHGGVKELAAGLCRYLGLPEAAAPKMIENEIIDNGFVINGPLQLFERLDGGKGKDRKIADGLRMARTMAPKDALDTYLDLFLTESREPRRQILSAQLAESDPALAESFDAERERIRCLFERLKASRTVERTQALLALLQRLFANYGHLKHRRGLLDFDDLIERTLALLNRSDAAWVLYKLDAGIDHFLVDEAQDTSEEQWEILRLLTDEFLSGNERTQRTFFAVGDEKQSIFSFQGAAPHKFEEMRRYFAEKMRIARRPFESIELTLSFRSVHDVLSAVDRIFSQPENYSGLSGDADKLRTVHESRKAGLPGRVELWEPVGGEERSVPRDWRLPVDTLDEQDPPVIVAQRVAEVVAKMTAPGAADSVCNGDGRPRPITPGDIMVLVRTRGAFFEAVIRALKAHRVPVAGADRLQLTDHIAVMDLIAVGHASILSEDDFALGCVLKSPLIGFDDDDLLALAPKRRGSLAETLNARAATHPAYAQAVDRLARWRSWARQLTPFEFYARLLGEDGGRRQLLARLGRETGDAIDEFLKLALDHEHRRPPSLVEFLTELEHRPTVIKRDMESGRNCVRVMTIHAAKGLEAKIVFLPDTCSMPNGRHDPKLFVLTEPGARPVVAWSARQDDDPSVVAAQRRRARNAAQDEYRRLLYVALTRAEERLYIAGFYAKKAIPRGCWYTIIRDSLADELQPFEAPWPGGAVWRRELIRPARPRPIEPPAPPPPTVLPSWLLTRVPSEASASPITRPSKLAEPGRGGVAGSSIRRGRLIHMLLQHLPKIAAERRKSAGQRFLANRAQDLSVGDRERLLGTAIGIIECDELTPLFGANSSAEVSIAGHLTAPDGRKIPIFGQIDRLAVLEQEAWIADFKSGHGGSIPSAYLRQLALYQALIARLHPEKTIRSVIVWTDGPTIVQVDEGALAAALKAVTHA